MHEGGQDIDESGELPSATSSQDVWSFGVVLLELCIGRTLFRQDTANDELVSEADRVILCAFLRCPDELLGEVFAASDAYSRSGGAEKLKRIRRCATDLIKMCLVADPEKRPTFDQILAHPFFFAEGGGDERALREVAHLSVDKFRFFLSHAQGDAASTGKVRAYFGEISVGSIDHSFIHSFARGFSEFVHTNDQYTPLHVCCERINTLQRRSTTC